MKSNNPYLCGNCVQKCSVQSKLELFKIIHSVQRSYLCKFCTLTFSDKYQAEGHEIVHDIRNHKIKTDKSQMIHVCKVWQYGLWSFQTGDTKLERFLPKNQHTQKKIIEFWVLSFGLMASCGKAPKFDSQSIFYVKNHLSLLWRIPI